MLFVDNRTILNDLQTPYFTHLIQVQALMRKSTLQFKLKMQERIEKCREIQKCREIREHLHKFLIRTTSFSAITF